MWWVTIQRSFTLTVGFASTIYASAQSYPESRVVCSGLFDATTGAVILGCDIPSLHSFATLRSAIPHDWLELSVFFATLKILCVFENFVCCIGKMRAAPATATRWADFLQYWDHRHSDRPHLRRIPFREQRLEKRENRPLRTKMPHKNTTFERAVHTT